MVDISSRIVGCGLGFVVTVLSGIVTSGLGKPYNPAVFGLHKIAAIGTIFLLVTIIRTLLASVEPDAIVSLVLTITGLLLLALFVSGALLALKIGPVAILRVHQVLPLPVIVFSALSVYLLLGGAGLARAGGPR